MKAQTTPPRRSLPPPSRDREGETVPVPQPFRARRRLIPRLQSCARASLRCALTHRHTRPCQLLPAPPHRPPPSPCRADCQPAAASPAGDPRHSPRFPSQAWGRGLPKFIRPRGTLLSQLSHWRPNRRRYQSREEVGRAWTGPVFLRGQAGSNWGTLRCLQSAGDSGVGSTPAPALEGPSQGCGEEGMTCSVSAACSSFQNGDCGLGGGMAGSGAGLEPKSGDSGGCCRVPYGGHGCHTSWLALRRRAQRDPSAGPGSRAPRLFPPHGQGPGFSETFKIQISEAPGWLSWLIVRLQLRS